ncbi:MAG TPA: DUF3592 domain-containing protein [Roseateles sp.]
MNNKNKNEMGRGWRGRIVGLLIFALFAIGFGWVGAGALKSLAVLLHNAWTVRSWQAVPIEVLQSELQSSTDHEGSTTYAVRARYRYEWAGRGYESTRVGLAGGGSDNLDDWHHGWEARLQAARDGGPPLQAWVDPVHPERAVLDRQLRWRQLLFLMPFAILFPLVAVGASWAGWLALTRGDTHEPAPAVPPRHRPRHNVIGLWLFAVVISVMALPVIGMASRPSAPFWVALIAGLFVLFGLGLMGAAVKATRRAWIYRGAFASFQPAQPRAGAAFQATWTLPPRDPASRPAQTGVRLRVAHYRIDDSGSGTSERLAEHFTQDVRPTASVDGGLLLQARFQLPVDAPSEGARRSGEKVAWRLEWLDDSEEIVMAVPIPVQAAAGPEDAELDRLSRERMPVRLHIPAASTEEVMTLPASVRLREQPGAVLLGFGQAGWQRFGILALVGLAMACHAGLVWLEALLLALCLDAFTRRWTLEVSDDGIVLDRGSWLWRRRIGLSGACLPGLYQRLLYSRNTGQGMAPFHALWARGVDRGSDLRLTPGLPGGGAAQVAQMLRWAFEQRGGRFSPGTLRDGMARRSAPGWGWLLCLLWVGVRLSAA